MRSWVAAIVGLACVLAAPEVLAQGMPRTADGHPDFQGVWDRHTQTLLERPPELTALIVPTDMAQETALKLLKGREVAIGGTPIENQPARTLNRVNGEFRSSQIIDPADGKLPYTDAGKALAEKSRVEWRSRPDSYEQRRTQERCITGAGRTPLAIMPELMLSRFVQTRDHLVIQTEHTGDLRIIPFASKHSSAAITSWRGDSIARWEGDTLVVETVNFRDDLGSMGMVERREAKVTEWFALVAVDELLYRFTVDDPLVYARPWMAEYTMRRSGQPIYENACHEGNHAIANILAGARADDRKEEAAKQRPKR